MLERIPPCYIIDQQGSCGTSIIGTSNTAEGFLARRIPDLKLDQLVFKIHHASTKLNTNRQVVDRLESLVCELQEQAGLSDAWDDGIKDLVGICVG